ncbi:MAG TPA: LCP family protein [Candidatus Limnocylindrales bacterium]|jgi:LCP family protein required for cell wall assembly
MLDSAVVIPAADLGAAPRARSRSLAVALSFLWPGLGHWYVGRRRAALTYGLPVVVVLALVVVRVLQGVDTFAISLFDPSFALTVIALTVALGAWRLLAMSDAATEPGRRFGGARTTRMTLVVLGLAAILVHSVVVYYAYSFYSAGSKIFIGGAHADDDYSNGLLGSPQPSELYLATPFATPQSATSRVTVLLTGIDHTTSRTESLNDTLLIASVNPLTKTISMVSFPRDVSEFPLYNGATYHGKINSLMEWAASHPQDFPDGPLPTLVHELSYLLGIPIHYYAAVDLDGFRQMIDAVGGVTVTVQRAIDDPSYSYLDGTHGFYLAAGVQVLDGRTALAYVRSRKGDGDNDFTRAGRQQQLLLALRARVTDPTVLARLPDLLSVAGETIRTDFPADRIAEMIDLTKSINGDGIKRVVLQPPTYSVHPPTNTTGGTYTLRLDLDAIARLSVEWFGADSRFAAKDAWVP